MKQAELSSIDQGGEKRRSGMARTLTRRAPGPCHRVWLAVTLRALPIRVS
jgi:hypothetical protein